MAALRYKHRMLYSRFQSSQAPNLTTKQKHLTTFTFLALTLLLGGCFGGGSDNEPAPASSSKGGQTSKPQDLDTPNTPTLPICPPVPAQSFMVVLDAGSSGTRAYLYKVVNQKKDESLKAIIEPVLEKEDDKNSKIWSFKVSKGLGKSGDEEIRSSLLQLMTKVSEKMNNDAELIKQTPLYLRATAGLRGLAADKQEHIIKVAREALRTTAFRIDNDDSIRVAKGYEEGLYAWANVNYQSKALTDKNVARAGILEMGGASMQIAFEPKENLDSDTTKDIYSVEIGNRKYTVYSAAYDTFGTDQSSEKYFKLHKDACEAPQQSIENPSTDPNAYMSCYDAVKKSVSLDAKCEHPNNCAFFGKFQPTPHGQFYAISNFARIPSDSKAANISASELRKAIPNVCSKSADDIRDKNGAFKVGFKPEELCFRVSFLYTLMVGDETNNLGFGFTANNTDAVIEPAKQIYKDDPSWTTGFAILEANKAVVH